MRYSSLRSPSKGNPSSFPLMVAALASVVLFPGPPVRAQAPAGGILLGAGYVASAPDLMGGVGGYVIFPVLGGIGLYLDAKFDTDSPGREGNFVKELTARQAEDLIPGVTFLDVKNSWRGFNAALVRPVNPSLMLYGGGGYGRRTPYRQYQDPAREYGTAGVFWVEASEEEVARVNLMAGVLMRLTPLVTTQFGFEKAPRGVTFGAMLKWPRH